VSTSSARPDSLDSFADYAQEQSFAVARAAATLQRLAADYILYNSTAIEIPSFVTYLDACAESERLARATAKAFRDADSGPRVSASWFFNGTKSWTSDYDPFTRIIVDQRAARESGWFGPCVDNVGSVGAVLIGPDGERYMLEDPEIGDDETWETISTGQGLILGDSVGTGSKLASAFLAGTGGPLPHGVAASPAWYRDNFRVGPDGMVSIGGVQQPGYPNGSVPFNGMPGPLKPSVSVADPKTLAAQPSDDRLSGMPLPSSANSKKGLYRVPDGSPPSPPPNPRFTPKGTQPGESRDRKNRSTRETKAAAAARQQARTNRDKPKLVERNLSRREVRAGGATAVGEMVMVGADAARNAGNNDDGYYSVQFQVSKDKKRRRAVLMVYQRGGTPHW
jgi:hypothetical protein